MAEQFLSDFGTPAINGNQAQRILANEVLRGVAQGVLETNGQGVTQRFSSDTSGAQIRITQFMPFNQEARELGAALNGENFDGRTAIQATTNGLGVDVIKTINQNIDIPQVTMDLLPIDFLANVTKNLEMDINNNINAMTIGGKFVASANAVANGNDSFVEITKDTATGAQWRRILNDMSARLDNGDADNGLAFFPDNDRCYVFQVSIIPYIFNEGILTLGGANHAYEMLAQGGLSPNAEQDIRSGYAGDIFNIPVYKATSLVLKLAAKYAGVPVWALDQVYGYLSSGYANVRAIAQNDQIKMIDSPDGQGVRVQPNFRMGFKSLYFKGNVFLVETGYKNPATAAAQLTLKGPSSRAAYSSDATLATVQVGAKNGVYNAQTKTYTVANAVVAEAAVVTLTPTVADVTLVEGPSTLAVVSGKTSTSKITVIAQDGTKVVYTLSVKGA